MKVLVNNKETVIESPSTIHQLTVKLMLPEMGVAIAVNNKLVPRTEWLNHLLIENDQVVIIKAACGG